MKLLRQQKGKPYSYLTLAAAALLWVSPPGFAVTPACQSAASDSDGDGWGWENSQSCVVALVPNDQAWPACIAANSDHDGDGYGWENEQTCVVTALTPELPPMQRPICQSHNSDPDGDGWGWENDRSCIVDNNDTDDGANSDHPLCLFDNSDPDGDGWGWENNQSCIVDDNNTDDMTDTGHPVCQLNNSDPDGDGWGWENNQSCIVEDNDADDNDDSNENDNNENADDELETPTEPPVTDSGFPICLTSTSDFNGTGFGYEFNQSCVIVDGVTATPDDPLLNTELCFDWAEIGYGNYRIQNNPWNESAVYSDDWTQCIALRQNNSGRYEPTWRFDWLDRNEGDEYLVKSYPQVYYGRKNPRNVSGTPAQTGLPRPVDELDSYQVEFAYSTSGVAEYNVALESFFHSSCDVDDDNKQFEMMVWVGVPDIRTPGTPVTTANIDGRTWQVYANPSLSWGYVAFVAEQTTTSALLDWNAFINWSIQNSSSLGLGSLDNTCMGAIEMGTETFWGELTFRLEQFDVTRN